jgi:large subunit ribosomal protein L13
MKTQFASKGDVERKWYLVDAEGAILGRLATKIATHLRGKNKPIFTPNIDTGDFVIVINADKIRLTGKKLENKIYYHHSGYPGGLKAEKAEDRLKRKPEEVIIDAVWGMLPKGRLGRAILKKLKVYRGSKHPHRAQKPEILSLE